MKVDLHLSRNVSISADGADHKSVFEELSGLAELFGRHWCGCCDADVPPLPQVRVVDNVKHYEVRCQSCGARLAYGQNKAGGTLYPRRVYHAQHVKVKQGQAKAGDRMPNQGWERWEGKPTPAPEDVPSAPRF